MSSTNFFFAGWEPIVRTVVVGIPMYIALVVFLRLSGSRTIASMNVFDFVVTVAIGSAFGRALSAQRVAFAQAITVFVLLISLQYTVAWLQSRWNVFAEALTNDPTLLYFQGEFLEDAMNDERVTKGEVKAAVRKQRRGSMADAEAVVLESDGSVSVTTTVGDASALEPAFPDSDDRQKRES